MLIPSIGVLHNCRRGLRRLIRKVSANIEPQRTADFGQVPSEMKLAGA
jgi:hypothetical protein